MDQEGLTSVAIDLDLGHFLKLGAGELKTGGNKRPSILSDAVEALFGAIYLDSDYETVERIIIQLYATYLVNMDPRELSKDPKTKWQEHLQASRFELPEYHVVEVLGEAHEQEFVVECRIPQHDIVARGNGSNRRSAEQKAARIAFELIVH